jgi:hypothetical protein
VGGTAARGYGGQAPRVRVGTAALLSTGGTPLSLRGNRAVGPARGSGRPLSVRYAVEFGG